jgi:cyclase
MKRRLNHRAPPAMARALRGQEAVPKQPGGTLQSVRFHELAAVGHENRFRQIRMFEKKCGAPGERERHDVAGRFSKSLQKPKGICFGSTPKTPQGAVEIRRVARLSKAHENPGMLYLNIMKRGFVLVGIIAAGTAAMVAALQAPAGPGAAAGGQAPGGRGGAPAPIQLQLERVRPGIYQIPIFNQSVAPGATTTVFVTQNNGVVIVDSKNPGSGQAIIDIVKKVTDKPITTIINTHTHNDHVGGNLAFEAVDLYFFGPAHTGGDTFVVFRNARVMAAGDVAPATGTPIIDPDNGGSGIQWGQTIAKAAAGIKNVEAVTRGHTSQTDTWAGFIEYGQYM